MLKGPLNFKMPFVFDFNSGVAILPGLTKEGYRVILSKMSDHDPSKFVYVDTIKL